MYTNTYYKYASLYFPFMQFSFFMRLSLIISLSCPDNYDT